MPLLWRLQHSSGLGVRAGPWSSLAGGGHVLIATGSVRIGHPGVGIRFAAFRCGQVDRINDLTGASFLWEQEGFSPVSPFTGSSNLMAALTCSWQP